MNIKILEVFLRKLGVVFPTPTGGGEGGGGELPADSAKALDTLMLGAPYWFDAPIFDVGVVELQPSGLDVLLTAYVRTPWSSGTVNWGDGSSGDLQMDASKNPGIGPQNQLVFHANPTLHTYTEAGTYTVTVTLTNAYGSDTSTQSITVPSAGGGV